MEQQQKPRGEFWETLALKINFNSTQFICKADVKIDWTNEEGKLKIQTKHKRDEGQEDEKT